MKKLGFLFALIAVLAMSTSAFAVTVAITTAPGDYVARSIDIKGALSDTADAVTVTPTTPTVITIKSQAISFDTPSRSADTLPITLSGTGKVVVDASPIYFAGGGTWGPSFKINSSVAEFEIKEKSIVSADVTITGGKFTLTGAVVSKLDINGASAEVVIKKGDGSAGAPAVIGMVGKTTVVTDVVSFVAGETGGASSSADVWFNGGVEVKGGHVKFNKSYASALSVDSTKAVVDIVGLEIQTGGGANVLNGLFIKDGTVNISGGGDANVPLNIRMPEAGTAAVAISGGRMTANMEPGNKAVVTLAPVDGGSTSFDVNATQLRGGTVYVDGVYEDGVGFAPTFANKNSIVGFGNIQGGEVEFRVPGAFRKGAVTVDGNPAPATSGTVVLSAFEAVGFARLGGTGGGGAAGSMRNGKLVLAAANAIPKTPVGATTLTGAIGAMLDLNGGTLVLQKPQEVYFLQGENVIANIGLVNLELTWGAGVKAARRDGFVGFPIGTAYKVTAVDVSAVKVNKGDKFAIFDVANTISVAREAIFREGKFEVASAIAQDYKVEIENGPVVGGADEQYEWQKVWLVALKDGPNPPNEDKLTGTLTGATSPVNFTAANDSVTVAVDWKINDGPIPVDGKVVETFSITPNGAAYFTVEEVDDGYKVTAKENGKGGKLVIRGEYPNSAVNYEVELAVNVAIVEEPTNVSSPSAEQTTDIINPAKAIAEAVLKANSDITYKILPSFAASGFSDGALVKVSEVYDLSGYWGEEGFYIAKIKADGSMTNFSPAGSAGVIDGAYSYDSATKMLTVYIADNSTAGFDLDDAMGAILDPIVVVKDGKAKKDSSGGGCNTAYAPFALLLAAPLFFLRKKD